MRTKKRSLTRRARRLLGVAGTGTAIFAASLPAAEFNYGIGYVGEYSTNVTAIPQNRLDEWIHVFTGNIGYRENTEALVARAAGRVDLRNYANDILPDDDLYTLDAAAIWTISPRRMTWTLEDVATQVTLNPTGPDTPANRAGANVLRTGPDLFFNISRRNVLSVGARYMNLYVGDSDVDNQSNTGTLRWLFESSPQTTWSANLQQQRVVLDNTLFNQNYRRNDAFFQFDQRYAQSQVVLLGGATRINREQSPELSGSVARLTLTRNLTPESVFGFAARVGYEDTSLELISNVSTPTAPLIPIRANAVGTAAISADVYYNRAADVFYTLRSSRVEYLVRVRASERDYKTLPLDREEAGGRLEANFLRSVTAAAGLFTDYLRTKHLALNRVDEDRTIGARTGYRVTRNTTFGFEASRHKRTSTDPIAQYVQNRYLLSVVYSSGPVRLPTER